MKSAILLLFAVIHFTSSSAQQIQLLTDSNKTSIRGLSAVNDKIIWVSGSNGTVGKSINGGNSWQWVIIKDFEKNDFRDIEAFDETTAIIMAVGEPAFILKTTDGGKTWKTVFADSTKGMFLDAMDFADEQHGVVIGDPVNNKIFLAYTENQGSTWKTDLKIKASEGEALFASSGTNIKMLRNKIDKTADLLFVTGGKKSRLFFDDTPHELQIIQGKSTQGANSIAFDIKSNKAVIVGGDFSKDSISKGNCALFSMENKNSFQIPVKAPFGYKSCVEYITENKLICCGTSGVDISEDGGNNWRHISQSSFHVCKKAKNGKIVFLAGINGKIARLNW